MHQSSQSHHHHCVCTCEGGGSGGRGWKECQDLNTGRGEGVGTHLGSWILREVTKNLLCLHQ